MADVIDSIFVQPAGVDKIMLSNMLSDLLLLLSSHTIERGRIKVTRSDLASRNSI